MKNPIHKCFGALLLAVGLLGTEAMQAATVPVTANISGTTTWRATNEYVLDGYIYVLDGGVLHIEAGTVIKALPGQQLDASALLVTRGGKIFAEGTRTKPIIFTAEADDPLDPDLLPTYQRGLWGGIVIMGNAVLNVATDTGGNGTTPKYDIMEGLPTNTVFNGQLVHRFGGNNDNDNSGVMRYVSIRRAGTVFAPNRELNGLTLCAVGSGTVIDHVESYAIADDGFEFFGGTVNTKYLVSAFVDDDCFDIDQGYRGKNQFWFAIQERGTKDNGGEWNGEPAGLTGANPVPPFANYTIYNATWIGAGTNTTANRGLQIRDYSAPRLYNSILTEFGGNALRVDTRSAFFLNNGTLDIRNNIWWNFATNGEPVALVETGTSGSSSDALVLFSDAARSNLVVNPMLAGINRTNQARLDPRPLPGSPALTSSRTAPDDGFYNPVSYMGAFDHNDLWLNDWTFLWAKGIIVQRAANVVPVAANISGNVTWRMTNEYVLDGYIYVLDGGVLNIEAGTVIKALPGQQLDASALFVTRGGKIFANGTANNPVIFTAEADDVYDPGLLPVFQRGLWGGIVVMGNAVLNVAADTGGNGSTPKYDIMEGLPTNTVFNGQLVHRYGGNNDNDNSGVLRYVSIRRAGTVFAPNRELNGLTLCAVGSGTTIDHVESYAIADDGVEFFGGTVNTKYLVAAFVDDDCFDIDQGFRGKNQFWFSIQERGTKDNAGEWNGEPAGLTGANPVPPFANYTIYNATLIGAGTNTTANRALQIRDYAAPRLYNSILTEFGGNGVRVDTRSAFFLNNGTLDIRDNLWWNFATNGVPVALVETGTSGSSSDALVLFSESSRSNIVADPMLRAISRTNDYRLDPRPAPGSPALAVHRATPNDGFFCPAPYKGAFSTVNWATDWTFLGEGSFITAVGAGVPSCTVVAVCTPPSLAIAKSGSDVIVSFTSQSGFGYQVESATSVTGPWGNEGSLLLGNGGTLTYTTATSGAQRFFRVTCGQ